MAEGESQTVTLAVERINQMLQMLREERQTLQAEREVVKKASATLLAHLDSMEEHWAMAERNMASSSRLEGELRESIREAHKLIDKLPGKRNQ